jgi:CspA family cold shock protein
VVTTGRILRFDETRGYGFIAPDDGGEDVFMHANDLRDEKYLFRPGITVAFEVEDGDRGLKASDVRLVDQSARSAPPVRQAPASPVRAPRTDEEDDGLCDVLSPVEFQHELTEALIESVPSLTAAQISHVRKRILQLAQSHSWVES